MLKSPSSDQILGCDGDMEFFMGMGWGISNGNGMGKI